MSDMGTTAYQCKKCDEHTATRKEVAIPRAAKRGRRVYIFRCSSCNYEWRAPAN